jgi:hypothetical protein
MIRFIARASALTAIVIAVLLAVPYAAHATSMLDNASMSVAPQGTVPSQPPGTVPSAPTPAQDDDGATDADTDPATDSDADSDTVTDDAAADTRVRLFRLPRRPVATPPLVRTGRVTLDGARVRSLIGDPHSSVLYAFDADGRLFRSEDGGQQWSAWVDAPQISAFLMSAASPDVLYAGTGASCEPVVASAPFLRSRDGGVTWQSLPSAAGLMPMLAHPGMAEAVLAADCDLPFASDDGGVSWAAKPDLSTERIWSTFRVQGMAAATLAGTEEPVLNYLYVAGQADDGRGIIAYSGDMGATWERITPQMSPAPQGIRALVADRHAAGRLWFVDANGVWGTEDFGAMWMVEDAGLDALADGDGFAADMVTSLLYVPDHGLYLGTDAGLFVLRDGADAWASVAVGGAESPAIRGLLAQDSAPGVLWVTTDRDVYTVSID